MTAHIAGLADFLTDIARTGTSEVGRRWEAERYLLRTDPLLALLLRAEAIADHRAENHVCEAAKLPAIRDLIRQAVEARTGKTFKNPLFP